jgi:hypothetical protein
MLVVLENQYISTPEKALKSGNAMTTCLKIFQILRFPLGTAIPLKIPNYKKTWNNIQFTCLQKRNERKHAAGD